MVKSPKANALLVLLAALSAETDRRRKDHFQVVGAMPLLPRA